MSMIRPLITENHQKTVDSSTVFFNHEKIAEKDKEQPLLALLAEAGTNQVSMELVDLESYEKVIICSPIWVFHLCAPMRSFCAQAAGRIRNVDYVLVHFQKAKYANACTEMDELLRVKHREAVSICIRQGKEVKRYEL